jgi:hypothetical protein
VGRIPSQALPDLTAPVKTHWAADFVQPTSAGVSAQQERTEPFFVNYGSGT